MLMPFPVRILCAACLIFVLAGCNTTQNPWDRPDYSRAAERAPSQLNRDAVARGQIYTPYRSPAAQAAAQAAVQQQQQAALQVPPQGQTVTPAAPVDSEALPGGRQGVYGAIPAQAAALPPVKVALLLPLSGPHADLGQAMLQAAQLALFDMGFESFELMPRDTKGTPAGAAEAARAAVTDGAQLVLGPLFAESVRAAKPVTQRYNVNMIGFSTDWSLAGGNTYIMGFLPFAQVTRVTEYAFANGYDDIAILTPGTAYGNAVVSAYNTVARRTGLRTANVTRLGTSENENSAILRRVTRYDERVQMVEERTAMLESRLAQNPNDSAARSELAALNAGENGIVPPFEAVLMPVGGDQARALASMLNFYELEPEDVKRIGTGLWDDPGLATDPALDGAWFAASSPALRADFENRYRALYGLRPPRLSTLAYDATALAAVLARGGYQATGRPAFTRHDLTNPNGFAGIDGIFRFRPDGLVERGLAVLEYRDSAITVIDPAPTTFERYDY